MCQVKLCQGQNINTSRGFSALAGTNGAFGNTGRAPDSFIRQVCWWYHPPAWQELYKPPNFTVQASYSRWAGGGKGKKNRSIKRHQTTKAEIWSRKTVPHGDAALIQLRLYVPLAMRGLDVEHGLVSESLRPFLHRSRHGYSHCMCYHSGECQNDIARCFEQTTRHDWAPSHATQPQMA